MFEIGQKLVFVGAHRYNAGVTDVEVTKVGRRWITASNGHRFDAETMLADGEGYSPPGSFYMSHEEYQTILHRERLWDAIREKTNRHHKAPDDVSLDALDGAARLLGITCG